MLASTKWIQENGRRTWNGFVMLFGYCTLSIKRVFYRKGRARERKRGGKGLASYSLCASFASPHLFTFPLFLLPIMLLWFIIFSAVGVVLCCAFHISKSLRFYHIMGFRCTIIIIGCNIVSV